MKKRVINYGLPAIFSDFNQDTSFENFSRGRLHVFYQGETEDHRYFSEKFSKLLVASLPYTPVVSYYDEEKEDFVGHATQQQILGIVDPCTVPTFEEHDGNTWCVCDVVLYTERPDKVGDIAKKIVGHKQSLELDPNSVEYIVNYDEKRHFKNIEFTAGRFVGVSVLGKNQKPAFTGSEFFAYNEEFEKKMQVLREYCESKQNQIQQGGEVMNLQEFVKWSWGDISSKVAEQICKEYEKDAYAYLIDIFDDSAIVRFYFYIEGVTKLMRVHYTCSDNGEITLGKINEVHIAYEDIEEPTPEKAEIDIDNINPQEVDIDAGFETEADEEEGVKDEEVENNPADEKDDEEEIVNHIAEDDNEVDDEDVNELSQDHPVKNDDTNECTSEEEDEKTCCAENANEEETPQDEKPDEEEEKEETGVETFVEPAQIENVEITTGEANHTMKVSVVNEEISDKQDSSSTSFTESERAEFETLKQEKKRTLINSYKDSLTSEEYDYFMENVTTFDVKDLELELLKAYKAKEHNSKPMRAFAFAPNNNAKTENSLDAFVRKNLR